jgi:hypothetical protein
MDNGIIEVLVRVISSAVNDTVVDEAFLTCIAMLMGTSAKVR